MATDARALLARLRPRRETVVLAPPVLAAELFVVGLFVVFGDLRALSLADLRLWVYPFVWINVGLWAVLRTDPAPADARTRRVAGLLTLGYVGVLAYAGGLVAGGHAGTPGEVNVVWATVPPGWGPAVTYAGELVTLTLVPFRVVGYLALAYLVYATILDASRSAVTGVLGFLSCVSCSWPVLASLAAGLAGGGSGVAAAVTAGSYDLSTLVFLVTVALLFWRPFGGE